MISLTHASLPSFVLTGCLAAPCGAMPRDLDPRVTLSWGTCTTQTQNAHFGDATKYDLIISVTNLTPADTVVGNDSPCGSAQVFRMPGVSTVREDVRRARACRI